MTLRDPSTELPTYGKSQISPPEPLYFPHQKADTCLVPRNPPRKDPHMRTWDPEYFFYTHAGYSWDPSVDVETEQEGRLRAAQELATAERWAAAENVEVMWGPDGEEGSVCMLRHGDDVASLGGIEVFPPHPYARVVEAELALDLMLGAGER